MQKPEQRIAIRTIMLTNMKARLRRLAQRAGFDILRYHPQLGHTSFVCDIAEDTQRIIRAVRAYTSQRVERLIALIDAVRYTIRSGVTGAIVECGVWRGGSMMAAALTLLEEQASPRDLYLFDTFEGMPPPGEHDRANTGMLVADMLCQESAPPPGTWCFADLEEVRANLSSTRYPAERVHYVRGKVEATVPGEAPDQIALLRLDTDWYESTKHELIHLYPRLVKGGVLLIDDYGHWQGARKAVDEYFGRPGSRVFMHRIDYTGRLIIKSE
jgi:O-methyltransferase